MSMGRFLILMPYKKHTKKEKCMKRTGETKTDRRKEKCMKRALLKRCVVVVAGLLVTVSTVWAKPLVSVAITAEKEVTVVVKGEKVKRRVPIKTIKPEEVIFYTLSYINSGDEAATNAVLDDPIPQGSAYIPGSATGAGAEIVFSIDGGKTFKKPTLLTYEVKNPNGSVDNRTASPEEYTHVRWIIDKIPAGAKGKVGFQVRINK